MRFSVGHTNKELAIRKVLIQQAYKTLKPYNRFPGWNGFSFLVHAAPPFPLPRRFRLGGRVGFGLLIHLPRGIIIAKGRAILWTNSR